LRSFIAQDVDVIAFSPVIETGWEPVMREIKKAGIPVVLSDRAVKVSDDSLYVTFIGSDFVEEGRRAANWLAKATDGKAVIAELVGTPGSAPAIDRKNGFEEVIAKYPDMKIVKSQSGDFTRAKGKEVMEAFLKSPDGKNITALFAHTTTWRSAQFKQWRKPELSQARTSSSSRSMGCAAHSKPWPPESLIVPSSAIR
jgi:galactofuranose transport system substrate-binding protein